MPSKLSACAQDLLKLLKNKGPMKISEILACRALNRKYTDIQIYNAVHNQVPTRIQRQGKVIQGANHGRKELAKYSIKKWDSTL